MFSIGDLIPLWIIILLIIFSPKIKEAIEFVRRPVPSPTPVGLRALQKYLRSFRFSLHNISGVQWEMLEREIDGSKQCLNPVDNVRLSSSDERQILVFSDASLFANVPAEIRRKGTTLKFGDYFVIIKDQDFDQKFVKLCESRKETIWNLARYGKENPSFIDHFIFRVLPKRYVQKFR